MMGSLGGLLFEIEGAAREREDKCDKEAVRSWILEMSTAVVWGPR